MVPWLCGSAPIVWAYQHRQTNGFRPDSVPILVSNVSNVTGFGLREGDLIVDGAKRAHVFRDLEVTAEDLER